MRTSGNRPAPHGLAPWLLLVAVFALAVEYAPRSLSLLQRVGCPFQVQQTEAYMVDRALCLLRGQSLYPDPSQGGPYILTAYPPLFFWLQAVFLKITGGLWLAGRSLALAGYLGCAMLLGGYGWRRWGWTPALVMALLFLLSPTWALWGSMVRPDSLALFFEFSAFFLLLRSAEGEEKHQTGAAFSAGLLAALAVLLKQTSVSLWFAFGLYASLTREWKRFRGFLAGCLPPVLLLLLYEQTATHGMFLKHVFLWLDTGYDPTLLKYFLLNRFLPETVWLVAALGLVLATKPLGLLLKCQLAFAAAQILLLGRNGGAENYWMEFYFYALLAVAEGLWGTPAKTRRIVDYGLPLVLVGLGMFHLGRCAWPSAPSIETDRMKTEALQLFRQPGEYLALDLDLVLMSGNRIWYQPVEYQYLFQKNRWKAEPLLSDIRARKFSTIELYDIPEQTLLPKVVTEEIGRDYRPFLRQYGRVWLAPTLLKKRL